MNLFLKAYILLILIVLNVNANEWVLVANKNFPIDTIDASDIKRLYLGKINQINVYTIDVLNQPLQKSITQDFIKQTTGMNDKSYLKWWLKQQIIGRGVPPKIMLSDTDVLERLKSNELTLGYIAKSKMNKDLKKIIIQ